MAVTLTPTPFSPYQTLEEHQRRSPQLAGRCGATASFVGTLRDFNEGARVSAMYLEHYPGMTERCLEAIREAAHRRWRLLDSLVVHRVGEIAMGEPIVLVAVWSSHRGEAFDACRYIVEELKTKAPFWKKERLQDGSRWVSDNSDGYAR